MSRCFAYSEAFDPDDPTLMDHYPTYDTNTDLGDRPPTLTCSFKTKSLKRTGRALISVKVISLQYLQKVFNWHCLVHYLDGKFTCFLLT